MRKYHYATRVYNSDHVEFEAIAKLLYDYGFLAKSYYNRLGPDSTSLIILGGKDKYDSIATVLNENLGGGYWSHHIQKLFKFPNEEG